jgi:hypothetical protein
VEGRGLPEYYGAHRHRQRDAALRGQGSYLALDSGGITMPGKRGRSAITRRFVKQSTVARNPKTTVNQSTKSKKK